MKVLNLRCAQQHSFEGWFASEDDFQAQLVSGLIECPLCGDKGIHKLPSAPRLNFGADQGGAQARGAASVNTALENAGARSTDAVLDVSTGAGPAGQAAFLKALRHVVANAEDVGERFALEARRMHYGEIERRSIRGQADVREVLDLLDEGLDVVPLPLLPGVKETLQ
ncbi:MAG: DUF1178 family protein [Polaromonas sp.]|nr:DUF1178 family protein [Polaromonas sp.]